MLGEPPATYTPDFPAAVWTSFDRYARYGAIARSLRACLGAGTLRVLDVGDPSGYLTIFDDDVAVVCADLTVVDDALAGAVRLAADGSALPFRDRAFDAVISSDSLEHVPDSKRAAFLTELARVSRDVVIVAAPFATDGVAGVEALARRYVLLVTGEAQDQLEEHAERGLPQVDASVAVMRSCGLEVAVEGNGNLEDWLLLMMLKHQLASRPALGPLDAAYDLAYNQAYEDRNRVGPFYRHVLCGRRSGAPTFGAPPSRGPDATLPDGSPVGEWLTATVAELGRQDNATEASKVHARLAITEERLSRLEAALDAMMHSLSDIQGLVESTHGLIRHPVRSVVGKVQRKSE